MVGFILFFELSLYQLCPCVSYSYFLPCSYTHFCLDIRGILPMECLLSPQTVDLVTIATP